MLRDFSPQAIKEFQAIWKRETGQEIDTDTALEYAQNVVGLVESVVDWRSANSQEKDP